jgi:hypothetical protein
MAQDKPVLDPQALRMQAALRANEFHDWEQPASHRRNFGAGEFIDLLVVAAAALAQINSGLVNSEEIIERLKKCYSWSRSWLAPGKAKKAEEPSPLSDRERLLALLFDSYTSTGVPMDGGRIAGLLGVTPGRCKELLSDLAAYDIVIKGAKDTWMFKPR